MSAGESGTCTGPSTPHEALRALLERVAVAGVEEVSSAEAAGRVLAEAIVSDRPSPPCDVSAMDGYGVRVADLKQGAVEVGPEAQVGQARCELPAGRAARIVTGAAIPLGADAVIKREDVQEYGGRISLPPGGRIPEPGENIRRRGENVDGGVVVVPRGTLVTPAVAGALAAFGQARVRAYRKVRVGMILTGDELVWAEGEVQPWHIRDSNGPALRALIGCCRWIELVRTWRMSDDPDRLEGAFREALSGCDGLVVTGGVSVGVHDHVPAAVRHAGGQVVFHRLPMRPGQPVLGAVGPAGQAILALPGNPVAVMVTGRRLAIPALAKCAGMSSPDPPAPKVALGNADDKTLGLWWYRLVRLTLPGVAHLVPTLGSGDYISAARSDGFVEMAPAAAGAGPWPYYAWQV
jgi:molybdopterin molybdotransferase